MSTARKHNDNRRSMSPQSRNGAYAAINILWLQMRPDLKWESKDDIRAARLEWIQNFLDLKRELKSTKDLTDGQIGLLLDEMKRLTGQSVKQSPTAVPPSGADNVTFLSAFRASEEQKHTLRKLFDFLQWSEDYKTEFLKKRKFPAEVSSLTFRKANSLTMILLNSAAHKDLKAQSKPTGRAATAAHIKNIKRKLQIGD